jgi:hypothetical protein
MSKRTGIKVVTNAERERRAEEVPDQTPDGATLPENVQDSATVFGKWIRERRQEKRSGKQKKAPAS